MKKKNFCIKVALFILMSGQFKTFAQSDWAGGTTALPHTWIGTEWVGWTNSGLNLNIEHRGIDDINFLTGTVQRMTIRGTNAVANAGFVGIGINAAAAPIVPVFPLDVFGDININNRGPLVPLGGGTNLNEAVYRIGGVRMISAYGGTNTFIGLNAGNSPNLVSGIPVPGTNFNTFVGIWAGGSISSGGNNVFVGDHAGFNATTAMENVFVGSDAGRGCTTGNTHNVYVGFRAGATNQTGGDNVFVGHLAGVAVTASNSTFVGSGAGQSTITGGSNTFIGNAAGNANVLGGNNTFLGFDAGRFNNSSFNTYLGDRAGRANTNGSENVYVGRIVAWVAGSGTNNTFLGSGVAQTLSGNNNFTNNIIIGRNAAGQSAGIGNNNTLIGTETSGFVNGANIIGMENVQVGHHSGRVNRADSSTFVGTYAGWSNTIGRRNSFYGWRSGNLNTTGQENCFFGLRSGTANTTGSDNTFIGYHAGLLNTITSENTSLGANSGPANATFTNSTAIGANSSIARNNAMVLGNGGGATFIDYHVGIGVNNPLGNFHVADMNGTANDGSNDIRFEDLPPEPDTLDVLTWDAANGRVYWADRDGFATNNCLMDGFVPYYETLSGAYECSIIQQMDAPSCVVPNTHTVIGIGYTAGTVPGTALTGLGACVDIGFAVNNYGALIGGIYYPSDSRLKNTISKIETPLEKIKKINGAGYYYNQNNEWDLKLMGGKQYGFIAQDIEKIIPEIVITTNNGYKAINYDALIPFLTEAIKEQQTQLDEKDEKIAQLESRLNDFENSLSECCMSYQSENDNLKPVSNLSNEIAKLEQNNPNPFTDNTFIKYFIPSQAAKAILKVYSLSGEELRSFIISEKGKGQINISGNSFAAGTYVYNLIVDDKQVDSKYMTLTK